MGQGGNSLVRERLNIAFLFSLSVLLCEPGNVRLRLKWFLGLFTGEAVPGRLAAHGPGSLLYVSLPCGLAQWAMLICRIVKGVHLSASVLLCPSYVFVALVSARPSLLG